jgi:Haloacid dehalogenase-like hydrolase
VYSVKVGALRSQPRCKKDALIVAEMFSVLKRLCLLDDCAIRDPSDSMIKAVIFDVDGTLVDSVDLHARAWQETFREFGKHIPFQEIRMQIGKGRDQSKIR